MNQKPEKIKSFTDLNTWQSGHDLVLNIYSEVKRFPKDEAFGLTSQLRRAAVSITCNIAEGFGRQTYREKVHFYYISQGSLTELKNLLLIARDVGYLNEKNFDLIADKANLTHQLL